MNTSSLTCPKLRQKKSLVEKLIKKLNKNPHNIARQPRVLSGKMDCTDIFKCKDEKTQFSVKYYYNMENGRDLYFDVRMFPEGIEVKKKMDTVVITSMSGKVGIRKVLNFLTENREKFVKIRKGILTMVNKRGIKKEGTNE